MSLAMLCLVSGHELCTLHMLVRPFQNVIYIYIDI